jgi:hypothetical protein
MLTKNNEFILIEPFRRKYEHLDFLQSILSVLIQKKYKLKFWTSSSYFSALEYKFKKQIDFHELKFDDKLVGIRRFFFSLYKTLAIILRNREKNILILSSLPVVSLIICLLSYLFNFKNIHLVINGELTCLASKKPSLSIKFDKFSCILFLKIGIRNGKILIISEKIYRDISSDQKLHTSVRFIEPIGVFYKSLGERVLNKKSPINFLSLGVQNAYKNSFELNKLALMFDRNYSKKKIIFNVLGKIDFEPGFIGNINLLSRHQNRLLDIKDFKNAAWKNHFLIFFLDETKYRYIASGSFFDSLKYNLPILALKNSFFDFYFSKFGSVGYLCEDVDEMANLINDHERLVKEYKSKVKNLEKARKYMSQSFLNSALFDSV